MDAKAYRIPFGFLKDIPRRLLGNRASRRPFVADQTKEVEVRVEWESHNPERFDRVREVRQQKLAESLELHLQEKKRA